MIPVRASLFAFPSTVVTSGCRDLLSEAVEVELLLADEDGAKMGLVTQSPPGQFEVWNELSDVVGF